MSSRSSVRSFEKQCGTSFCHKDWNIENQNLVSRRFIVQTSLDQLDKILKNKKYITTVSYCQGCIDYVNRGIEHDIPFINIRKVPREVLKTEGEDRGFQLSQGTLRMLMNDKIMFDRYYCINSAKQYGNEQNSRTIFYNLIFSYASTLLKTMHDSGPVQIIIILHALWVAPSNKHN